MRRVRRFASAKSQLTQGHAVDLIVTASLKVAHNRWERGNQGSVVKDIIDALCLGGKVENISIREAGFSRVAGRTRCHVCGFTHDPAFTQILVPDNEAITLAGVLPDIVRCVHAAHEKNFPRLSTKDDGLLRRCGGYRNPCKAFYDLRQSAAYKVLFDTSRRGFIALRGFGRKES